MRWWAESTHEINKIPRRELELATLQSYAANFRPRTLRQRMWRMTKSLTLGRFLEFCSVQSLHVLFPMICAQEPPVTKITGVRPFKCMLCANMPIKITTFSKVFFTAAVLMGTSEIWDASVNKKVSFQILQAASDLSAFRKATLERLCSIRSPYNPQIGRIWLFTW